MSVEEQLGFDHTFGMMNNREINVIIFSGRTMKRQLKRFGLFRRTLYWYTGCLFGRSYLKLVEHFKDGAVMVYNFCVFFKFQSVYRM